MDECGVFPLISKAATGSVETEITRNAATNGTDPRPDVNVDLVKGCKADGADEDEAFIDEGLPVEDDALDSDHDEIHARVSHNSAGGQAGFERASGKKKQGKKKKRKIETKEEAGSSSSLTKGVMHSDKNLATDKSIDEAGRGLKNKDPVGACPPGSFSYANGEVRRIGESRPPLVKKKAAKRRAQRKKFQEAAKAAAAAAVAALVSDVPTANIDKPSETTGSAGEGEEVVGSAAKKAGAKRKRGKYVVRNEARGGKGQWGRLGKGSERR